MVDLTKAIQALEMNLILLKTNQRAIERSLMYSEEVKKGKRDEIISHEKGIEFLKALNCSKYLSNYSWQESTKCF